MPVTQHLNGEASILKELGAKFKILYLEDQNSDVLLVKKAINVGDVDFDMFVVDTKDSFVNALIDFSPDIILADHCLSSFNSHEALDILKRTQKKIPLIIVTAAIHEAFAMDLVNKGAEDYILKDRLGRLPVAIRRSVEKCHLEQKRQFLLDKLAKKERRFRTLVESNVDNGVVILNANAKPTYVSPSVKQVLGYTEEEVMQIDLFTISHPDDQAAIKHVMERVLATPGVSIKGHTGRMLHKDGSWRWIEATVTNLLHDPAINGIIDHFRDVTVRKIAEEKLIDSETKFQALIENGVDGIAILSASGKPMYVSPSIKNVLGYGHEERNHLDLLALAHPDDVPILLNVMQQAMTQPGVPVKGEATRMRHKDGSWRWIDGVITNMLHDPVINGILDNFRDVTESKLAEEKIIHANRLYAFISQINQTILHAADEEGVFKEACRIATDTGRFKAAWIGMIDPENQRISLVEESGISQKDRFRFMNLPIENNGPQAQVLQNGYYICNDFQNEFTLHHWKQFAADSGVGSMMVVPIRKSGHIVGTFNFYATEINFFTSSEIELLTEATADISFSLDFFERHKQKLAADELLKHNELRLNQAQAFAHVGSWEFNFSSGISTWSEEARRIYGMPLESNQYTYATWISLVHPDDLDYVLYLKKEASATLSATSIPHRIKRKDGTVRHVITQSQYEIDSENKPVGLYGITHDVTEIHKAAEELLVSEANLQAIFDNTSEGFALFDVNGNVKTFNTRAKDSILLNSNAHVENGANIYDFVEKSRKEDFKHLISKVLAGETIGYDHRYEREDGEKSWFHFILNPVYNAGKMEGFCITGSDVTERKHTEELLHTSESNLNAIIENTDAFIYSLDTDFRYIIFNQRLHDSIRDVYGIDLKTGYNVFDLIRKYIPGELEEWTNVYTKALNGEIVKFEKAYTVNGFSTYSSFSIHPMWKKDTVIGISCFVNDITEEKHSEDALKQSEFRYRQIVETAQEGIWTIDANRYTTFVNEKMCEILGYPSAEIIGRQLFDFMDAEGIRLAKNKFETQNRKALQNFECKFITKSGAIIWTTVNINPIFGAGEEYEGALGMVSDITKKRDLQNLLDKTNQLARIGSWEVNLTNKTLFWSAITKEIHEVDPDYVPDFDASFHFFKPGISRDIVVQAMQEAIEKGISFDLQLQIITAGGKERWVRSIGSAEYLDGKCIRLNGSFQDIDAGKRAEMEVLKVYEEKNNILESIGDAFFAVDKSWLVTYWNNQAEKMLHVSKNVIVGQYLWDVFSDAADSETYKNLHQAIQTKQSIYFKDSYPSLNKWFEINVYPSNNGLSVFFKDITEQRKSEFERDKMTADIVQRNNDLEQFSYIISHNLRAPVANIIGFSNAMQKEELGEGLKKKIISGLSSSVSTLDEVIKDLNNILQVRQESNKHKQMVNFTKLTQDVELSIASMLLAEQAVIVCDYSEVSEMLTIKSYLHSIFYNLISNSLKYRQPGISPHIEIKSQKRNKKIVLVFKDNGLGIDLEKRGSQVFGLYKRFHSNQAEGKGMGLYMVKTQVELIGGKISIQSEINKGTEFTMEFGI